MRTHVVPQKCSVTVFNVVSIPLIVKAKKNRNEGLSFMLCHMVTYKGQLFTTFWCPHFSRNGHDLPPCSCHANTTYCAWLYEVVRPGHLFNFLYISNLIPKSERGASSLEQSWNSLTGQSVWPSPSVMTLELASIKQMVNEPYIPDSYNKFKY